MRAALVALMVLVAACAGEAAVETSTSMVPVAESTTTSTTVQSKTATVDAESVDLCRRGEIWVPGVSYVAPCFAVPEVSFEPEDVGWRSTSATSGSVEGLWVEEESGEVAARFKVWVYQGQGGAESAVAAILEIDGVSATSEPTDVTGRAAAVVVADVETDPVSDVVDQSGKPVECAGPSRSFGGPLGYWPGYELPGIDKEGSTGTVGLGACRLFRVWAVDAQAVTLIVSWTADDPSRFGELVGMADRFFDSMTFETS